LAGNPRKIVPVPHISKKSYRPEIKIGLAASALLAEWDAGVTASLFVPRMASAYIA
jgi:hypothetical protein